MDHHFVDFRLKDKQNTGDVTTAEGVFIGLYIISYVCVFYLVSNGV